MATTNTWLHAVSGNFNTAADWSSGVPNLFDDAELSATGTYTVTSSQSNIVYGLELNAKTALAITEGTFFDLDGTDGLDDAGTIAIGNNTMFIVGFGVSVTGAIPLDVSGAMTLNSAGSPTTLILDGFGSSSTDTIDLFGGGKLTLSSNANNLITTQASGTILETSDTISGAGTIRGLTLQNGGLIDANGLKALVILNGASDTNTGTIEDTSTGGLDLVNAAIENALGTIKAAALGAVVNLEDTSITDGTVSTVAGSSIVLASGTSTVLNVGAVNNAGTIRINPNSGLTLGAAVEVNNSGVIALNATGVQSGYLALIGTDTFEGKGKVILSDDSGNLIESNGATTILDNQNNTISGAGTIGDSNMTLDNVGTIDGTGKNALIIAATGANVQNFGTIESSSTGGLEFLNVTVNDETTGTVKTTAVGSHIDLSNSTIEFGSMTIVAGSTLDLIGTTDTVVPTSALNNAGTVAVNGGSTLVLGSTVNNTGTIALNGNIHPANIEIDGNIALADTGKVNLANAADAIVSNVSMANLTNVANTISGEGTIGDLFLTFNNDTHGVVDATGGFGNQLVINTANHTVFNSGTMEDTGAGGLAIDSPLDNSGTIQSAGPGGVAISNTIDNTGKLIADDGILSIADTPSGGTAGSLTIGGSGEISFGSSATGIAQNVTFSLGATGTLAFAAAATTTPTTIYGGTISGFGPSDSIDLAGLSFTFDTTTVSPPVFSAGDTTISVTNGTDTVALTFAGNLTSHTFVVGDDGSGGTRLTDPVAKTTGTHVASSPITMLGSIGNGLPLIDHVGASNVALLGNYMASMFAAEGQVAAPMTMETGPSQALLAHPHAG